MRRSGKQSQPSHAKVLSASGTRVDEKVRALKKAALNSPDRQNVLEEIFP
jgi:hypothetical protein